jgi:hypothetical protein
LFSKLLLQDEGLQEKMDAIRGRYKTAVSLLGLPDASSETQQLSRQQGAATAADGFEF